MTLSACSDGVHPSVASSSEAASTGSTAAQAAPPVSYVRSTVFANLTVRHPAAWRLVPVEMWGSGPSSVVGFLTDQTTHTQCSTSGIPTGIKTTTCGPPVTSIGPDGVYLVFTGHFLIPGPPASHNRVLDGPSGSGQTVTMTACFAGPDSGRIRHELDAMIDSVQFT